MCIRDSYYCLYKFRSIYGVLSSSKFLNSFKILGFIRAWIFFILFPSIIFLTAISTIFPFFVLGISETSIIFLGTCRGDASLRIAFFKLKDKSSFNDLGFLRTTNNIILTSLSHFWPITIDSFTSLNLSTTEYISAVPNLAPPGFSVASDLP